MSKRQVWVVEGRATAAEWASRYTDLAAAAYPVLGVLAVNDPAQRMAKERLEGVLAGREWTQADVDSAVWEASAKMREAELTRLKEENARAKREATDAWESSRLEREHRVKAIDSLANEKAAHEVTVRGLRKRDPVIAAAREYAAAGPVESDQPFGKRRRLREALSALDQPTQAQPATPPELPDSSGEATREIKVGSTWRQCMPPGIHVEVLSAVGGVQYQWRGSKGALGDYDDVSEKEFRLWFTHVRDPEPPVERPIVVGSIWKNEAYGYIRTVTNVTRAEVFFSEPGGFTDQWDRALFTTKHTWVSDPEPPVEAL